jgi:hypothetical protein
MLTRVSPNGLISIKKFLCTLWVLLPILEGQTMVLRAFLPDDALLGWCSACVSIAATGLNAFDLSAL